MIRRKFLRILTFLAFFLLLIANTHISAFDQNATTNTYRIFTSTTVSAGGSATSGAVDISNARGYFSIQYAVTGDGTLKLSYQLSNDAITWITPSSAADIATGITKTSGPNSDGKDLVSFSPEMAKYIQIVATETGGANSATITAMMAVQ